MQICSGGTYRQSVFWFQGQRPVTYQRWSKAIDRISDQIISLRSMKLGLKARPIRKLVPESWCEMNRAFSPQSIFRFGQLTRSAGPRWYGTSLWPWSKTFKIRCFKWIANCSIKAGLVANYQQLQKNVNKSEKFRDFQHDSSCTMKWRRNQGRFCLAKPRLKSIKFFMFLGSAKKKLCLSSSTYVIFNLYANWNHVDSIEPEQHLTLIFSCR
jgi:hypothetical protein